MLTLAPQHETSSRHPMTGPKVWDRATFDAESHMLTVETYILAALPEWLLEVSVSDIPDRTAHEALVGRVISGIRATHSTQCDRMS